MRKLVALLVLLAACTGEVTGPTEAPTETTAPPGSTTAAPDGAGVPETGWASHAPMSTARSEHPAVVLDGKLVVMGGLIELAVGQSAATNLVESYDPATDIWSPLPALRAQRHHGMAAVVGERLFYIGGYSGSGFTAVSDVWELVDGSWEERAPLPVPVGAGAAVVVDDLVYVVGGTSFAGFLGYDPGADAWETLASPDQEREHVAAVADDGEVWAIAGRWDGTAFATTEVYDIAAGTWRAGPELVVTRSGFGATVVGEVIVVAGGEVFSPLRARDSAEMLTPGGEWVEIVPLPHGLHGNPLATIGDRVYLPGGSMEPAGVDNDPTLYSLRP